MDLEVERVNSEDSGSTLIELLIGLTLFLTVLQPLISATIRHGRGVSGSAIISAGLLADNQLRQLTQDPSSFRQTQRKIFNNRFYRIERSVHKIDTELFELTVRVFAEGRLLPLTELSTFRNSREINEDESKGS